MCASGSSGSATPNRRIWRGDLMGRPRLAIGTYGEIGFQRAASGRIVARARYRDWNGKTRLVQATGDTRKSAERALKAKLADRSLFQPSSSALTPDSPFSGLVAYWLEDLELEDRLSKRTLQLYERNMQTLVMPAFGNLTLREIGVARCDHFLKQLAKQSYNRAKQARVVLRLALGLAVRHEVLPRNPMNHVSRVHRPALTPNALTPAEVNAIRTAIAFWEAGRSISGPKPDGRLGASPRHRSGDRGPCRVWVSRGHGRLSGDLGASGPPPRRPAHPHEVKERRHGASRRGAPKTDGADCHAGVVTEDARADEEAAPPAEPIRLLGPGDAAENPVHVRREHLCAAPRGRRSGLVASARAAFHLQRDEVHHHGTGRLGSAAARRSARSRRAATRASR